MQQPAQHQRVAQHQSWAVTACRRPDDYFPANRQAAPPIEVLNLTGPTKRPKPSSGHVQKALLKKIIV